MSTAKRTNRIGIDGENVLVEGWINTNDISHLMIDFQLQRCHWRIEMDTVEVLHQENLTVTLATIAWPGPLSRSANLDNHDVSVMNR